MKITRNGIKCHNFDVHVLVFLPVNTVLIYNLAEIISMQKQNFYHKIDTCKDDSYEMSSFIFSEKLKKKKKKKKKKNQNGFCYNSV